MVHQRYGVPSSLKMIISSNIFLISFLTTSLLIWWIKGWNLLFLTCSPEFLRQDRPLLAMKCLCPSSWNCDPPPLLRDYCQWCPNGASKTHSCTYKAKTGFLWIFSGFILIQTFVYWSHTIEQASCCRHMAKKITKNKTLKLIHGTWLVASMPLQIQTSGDIKENL